MDFKGWMTRHFFWLIRISVSQNLPESNKSSYWAGDAVKNTVKSWNSQMNFHSVEISLHDVNCRKRHHSGSTLLHMRACAMGSQSPTSTTLTHFWLLGSKYQCEMDPKTKTNTYKFTAFTLSSKWSTLSAWPLTSHQTCDIIRHINGRLGSAFLKTFFRWCQFSYL